MDVATSGKDNHYKAQLKMWGFSPVSSSGQIELQMFSLRNIFSKLLGNAPSSKEAQGDAHQIQAEPFITITEDELTCAYPSQKKTERIIWTNILAVDVLTTDEGPYVCDVFILIRDNEGGVAIPHDREECKLVIDRIFKLPEFNFVQFATAMGSSDNQMFNVWQKSSTV